MSEWKELAKNTYEKELMLIQMVSGLFKNA